MHEITFRAQNINNNKVIFIDFVVNLEMLRNLNFNGKFYFLFLQINSLES